MSQDFLSQEEVDALLKGVTPEEDDIPSRERIVPFDLATNGRIIRGRMPLLEAILERTAFHSAKILRDFRHTEVFVSPIRIQKYNEFVRNLIFPSSLNVVSFSSLEGHSLVVLDPTLVDMITDVIFGGDCRFHTRTDALEHTRTCSDIIDFFLGKFLVALSKSWGQYLDHKLEHRIVSRETRSQYVDIAMPNEIVVATHFTWEISGMTAELHVCLPLNTLRPVLDSLHARNVSSYKKGYPIPANPIIKADAIGDLGEVPVEEIRKLVGSWLPIRGVSLSVEGQDICPVALDGRICTLESK